MTPGDVITSCCCVGGHGSRRSSLQRSLGVTRRSADSARWHGHKEGEGRATGQLKQRSMGPDPVTGLPRSERLQRAGRCTPRGHSRVLNAQTGMERIQRPHIRGQGGSLDRTSHDDRMSMRRWVLLHKGTAAEGDGNASSPVRNSGGTSPQKSRLLKTIFWVHTIFLDFPIFSK